MTNKLFSSIIILLAALTAGGIFVSCNNDDVITAGAAPRIILDNPDGVYEIKAGQYLTIAPQYVNADDATYQWKVDGVTVADTPILTYKWEDTGEYYVDITVTTPGGRVTSEMRVDVIEPGIPYISLPITDNELTIALSTDYLLTPEIANSTSEDLTVSWKINGQAAGDGPTLHFQANELGSYEITVTATNSDGTDTKDFTIHVVEHLPFELYFPELSYYQTSTTRFTFVNRAVYLCPVISQLDAMSFSWSVNGDRTDCDTRAFVFTPSEKGEYIINVTVDGKATASMTVICVDTDEATRRRAITATSQPTANRVFEWVPAPGQFIGDTRTGGMTADITTHDRAIAWAESRLEQKNYVSLGGFGGYIIVGFDHSIPASENDYDFSIQANAFFNASTGKGGSNEPGIIWVSQDVNGNGIPDDEWYELRGSETGKSTTLVGYAVTYFRPAAPKMNVQWTDNIGATGTIDYLQSFHTQDYYYPAWIEPDSYTLRGTRLQAQTTYNSETGLWDNNEYPWGYADNMGSDCLDSNDAAGGEGQRNGFKIKNAMLPDGTAVTLEYVDFIRVQTGVNSKAGWLGEVSTEVFDFRDLSIK